MGKNSQKRRAAKAKRRAEERRRATNAPEFSLPADEREEVRERRPARISDADRIHFALHEAIDARAAGDRRLADRLVDAIAGHDPSLAAEVTEQQLLHSLSILWAGGWQPTELVRRGHRASARTGRILTAAVLADHDARPSESLHPDWAAQIGELEFGRATKRSRWLLTLLRTERLTPLEAARAMIEAVEVCVTAPPLPVLLPPPGQQSAPPAGRRRDLDDGVLAKVRALLAQAESTTFDAEAETFTAKAQELMSRHAIDHALVWDEAGRDERPTTVRLPVDDPYADSKALLLHVVAIGNGCRAVVHDGLGLVSVVGFTSDVAATQVLYTSLLLQAQVALQAEAHAAPAGSRVRSRSFRSSFLNAYAHRIGDRLAAVNRTVQSDADADADGALLPVLVARKDLVDHAVDELFGELTSSPVRGGSDGLGWARGALAADRARLHAGDLVDAGPRHALPGPG